MKEEPNVSSRDLLLMAAAVHELGPGTNLSYANTAKAMRQALHWAGLLRGWGGPWGPRASAHFTSCRLTERGWLLANQLLERHPCYREDVHVRRSKPAGW